MSFSFFPNNFIEYRVLGSNLTLLKDSVSDSLCRLMIWSSQNFPFSQWVSLCGLAAQITFYIWNLKSNNFTGIITGLSNSMLTFPGYTVSFQTVDSSSPKLFLIYIFKFLFHLLLPSWEILLYFHSCLPFPFNPFLTISLSLSSFHDCFLHTTFCHF